MRNQKNMNVPIPAPIEISEDDSVEIVRELIGIRDRTLRKIDLKIAKEIMGWRKIQETPGGSGYWTGKTPEGIRSLVPFYSVHEKAALDIVSQLTRCKRIRAREPADSLYDGPFFIYEFLSKKNRKFRSIAYSKEKTKALAICTASLDLVRFLKICDLWPPEEE